MVLSVTTRAVSCGGGNVASSPPACLAVEARFCHEGSAPRSRRLLSRNLESRGRGKSEFPRCSSRAKCALAHQRLGVSVNEQQVSPYVDERTVTLLQIVTGLPRWRLYFVGCSLYMVLGWFGDLRIATVDPVITMMLNIASVFMTCFQLWPNA